MWKGAIVGAGFLARNHLLAWQANPKVAVTALCDVDPARLAGRGEEFGIPREARFGDVDAMLARVDVDIVDVVTPPKPHLPLVSAAARAGKHMMYMKPFAESIAEAREMAEVVERYGVRAMVTESWRRFHPIRRLERALDDGLVGTLETSWVSRCNLPDEKQHHEQMIIEGDRATVTMGAGDEIRLVGSDGSMRVMEERAELDSIARIEELQSHFIRGLENSAPLETDIAGNHKTLELVFAAYESAAAHEVRKLG